MFSRGKLMVEMVRQNPAQSNESSKDDVVESVESVLVDTITMDQLYNNNINIEDVTVIPFDFEEPQQLEINETEQDISGHSTENTMSKPLQSEVNENNHAEDADQAEELEPTRERRQRLADPSQWRDKKNKRLRELGKSYEGWTKPKRLKAQRGARRKERKMGSPCRSDVCKTSKLRNCADISESQRKEIFTDFWSEMNWDQKKVYITSHINTVSTKRATTGTRENSRRQQTLQYFLPSSTGGTLQVCRKMFLSTFSLKESMISDWVKKSKNKMCVAQTTINERRRPLRLSQPKDVEKQDLSKFLDSLPKLPSHYCRQSTKKMYIEPVFGNTMTSVYHEYVKWCSSSSAKEPLSVTKFHAVVKEKNIALHQPKKDQCDLCCSFKVGNLSEVEYNKHLMRKEKARDEKGSDKERGKRNECIVLTQDLQAVKICPFLEASAIYYKTKLCCHNFTVFDINSHKSRCYWFTEIDADLNATTFASFIVDYLQDVYEEGKSIIIWSDSCGYQNKNATLSNALLSFSVEKWTIIEQKFLEKGHTQMEADSVHATIERRLKGKPIYIPNDYVEHTKQARVRPCPYEVKRISFDFINNYDDNVIYPSIRPGRKVGEPTVNEIKAIKYTPDGKIQVKLDFASDYIDLPRRRKHNSSKVNKLEDFKQCRDEEIKIKHQKWVHLQQLKEVIPKDFHSYYDSIPHLEI